MGPETLVQLIGFATSHALTSMESGEQLVPFLIKENRSKTRSMERFMLEPWEAQQRVFPMLGEGIPGAERAALAVSGRQNDGDETKPMIIVDGAEWGLPLEVTVRLHVQPKVLRHGLKVQAIAFDDILPGSDHHTWAVGHMVYGMREHPAGEEWAEVLSSLN